jgi:Tfp pilus assembly protein PilE
MPGERVKRTQRAFGLVETMAAVLVVSVAAIAAIATWGFSTAVVGNKRVTEMANYLGTREIERIKAKTYAYAPASSTTYYDKTGASITGPVSLGYMVESTVTVAVSRGSTPSSADLDEIQVQVWNSSGTQRYDDGNIRTLLSTGGM